MEECDGEFHVALELDPRLFERHAVPQAGHDVMELYADEHGQLWELGMCGRCGALIARQLERTREESLPPVERGAND
jgi:hypothetical protein